MIGAGGHARVLLDALQLSARPNLRIHRSCVDQGENEGPGGFPCSAVTRRLRSSRPADGAASERDRIDRSDARRATPSIGAARRRASPSRRSYIRSAVVSKSAKLAEASRSWPVASFRPAPNIGANSIVNTRASVDHDCSNRRERAHRAGSDIVRQRYASAMVPISGPARCVIQGITIDADSLVAAGAVVYRDLACKKPPDPRVMRAHPCRTSRKHWFYRRRASRMSSRQSSARSKGRASGR